MCLRDPIGTTITVSFVGQNSCRRNYLTPSRKVMLLRTMSTIGFVLSASQTSGTISNGRLGTSDCIFTLSDISRPWESQGTTKWGRYVTAHTSR
jgi:hypothetical protein